LHSFRLFRNFQGIVPKFLIINYQLSIMQLDTVGVIALLPGELPERRILEIVDALLAAPVPAVEIIPNGPRTLDTLETLRRRAGDLMLVGAGRVESLEELDAVMAAGAQFGSTSADFSLPLLAHARKHNFLWFPTVHAPGQTLIAARAGALWQKIRDDLDVEGLEGLQERADMAGYPVRYIVNQISADDVDAARAAGASLVCVNDIYTDADQPMADLITRARTAMRLWESATP
jgi:hypothetical protein